VKSAYGEVKSVCIRYNPRKTRAYSCGPSRRSRACPASVDSNRGELVVPARHAPIWTINALLVEVPEQFGVPSLQLQRQSSSVLLAGMENGCGGISLSLSFRMESTTDGSRIPCLAEFAGVKTNSSGLITPKAGWSIRFSQRQSSLVDETGIEPPASSLRTVGKIS
jgi:hypothetical protein